MKKIELCYPSFTRKAITFTIDDGNMKYDKMLLDILKPAGIKGTFNLCSDISRTDNCREFYEGYEIANHVKYHPLVNFDGVDYIISEDEFNEETANKSLIYRVKGSEEFFWVIRPNGWRKMVFEENFIRFIDDGKRELEQIFGEDSVRDFVWPYGEQDNKALKNFIRKTHRSARKTGCTFDRTGFAIPDDKYAWSYNANHMNLVDTMEKYEAYTDESGLKFFAFGVHSVDFERDGKWDELRTFAQRFGNRPNTYWYASVGEIFDYEEASQAVEIGENYIKNPTKLTVYYKIDGKNVAILPDERIEF